MQGLKIARDKTTIIFAKIKSCKKGEIALGSNVLKTKIPFPSLKKCCDLK